MSITFAQRWLGIGALALALPLAASAQQAFTRGSVNLRAGPSNDYPSIARLAPGQSVQVMGCTGGYGWCDVVLPDGLRGWAAATRLNYPYGGGYVPLSGYGASIGVPIVEAVRRVTDLPLDVHLMISEPARYIEAFRKAGADSLTIHVEAVPDPRPVLDRICELGALAGLALNPPTPLSAIETSLPHCDLVLVMSVMPGFGGQSFEASVLEKVRALRADRPELPISIDGGINPTTAAEAVAAGVTQLVAGSAVFRRDGNYAAALAELAKGARRGLLRGGGPAPRPGSPSQP